MATVDSTHNSVPSGDATCVFRMPMNDMTAPDLMKAQVISKPVLTIIKGPQTGNTFELEGAPLGSLSRTLVRSMAPGSMGPS